MAVSLHSPWIYTPLDFEIQQSNDPCWNTTSSFLNSDWIGAADSYSDDYYRDSRFTIGIVLFVAGFILNRYPDRFSHRSPLLSPANTDRWRRQIQPILLGLTSPICSSTELLYHIKFTL